MSVYTYGRTYNLPLLEMQAEESVYGGECPRAIIVEAYRQEWLDKNPEAYGDLLYVVGAADCEEIDDDLQSWVEARGYDDADIKSDIVKIEGES